MIGVAIRKEKCAAPSWSMPRSKPPTIVAPEREMPGISAVHCQQPIDQCIDHGKLGQRPVAVRAQLLAT